MTRSFRTKVLVFAVDINFGHFVPPDRPTYNINWNTGSRSHHVINLLRANHLPLGSTRAVHSTSLKTSALPNTMTANNTRNGVVSHPFHPLVEEITKDSSANKSTRAFTEKLSDQEADDIGGPIIDYLQQCRNNGIRPQFGHESFKRLVNMAAPQSWWNQSFTLELQADERERLQFYAELWLQQELVDDRNPRPAHTALTCWQNDGRSCARLEELYENDFQELCRYWSCQEELINYVFYGDQRPRRLLTNCVTRYEFFKECLYCLRRSLKELLRYNLIAKMPRYKPHSRYRLHWIRYRSGENWLQKSLSQPVEQMLQMHLPPPAATIRWPGDDSPAPEPASSLLDAFANKIRKREFGKKLIECADFPHLEGRKFDNDEPVAIHHVISKALLFKLLDRLGRYGRRSTKCPLIDHRFDNIVDHNYRKFYMIQIWKNRTGKNPRKYRADGPPDPFPKECKIFRTRKYQDICGRSVIWREGNLFAGPLPALRGPFDPNTWRESIMDFEADTKPILGAKRYAELRILHDCVQKFTQLSQPTAEQADQIRDHWLDVFWRYHLVMPNEKQWRRRHATPEELHNLNRIPPEFKTYKYWAIKSEAEIIQEAASTSGCASTSNSRHF